MPKIDPATSAHDPQRIAAILFEPTLDGATALAVIDKRQATIAGTTIDITLVKDEDSGLYYEVKVDAVSLQWLEAHWPKEHKEFSEIMKSAET